jgi:hypothetical protein
VTRNDITPEAVAKRWLSGETILALAISLEVSEELIKRRLRKARKDLPDLPWTQRSATQTRGSVQEYREMKDGVPGARSLKQGSIVHGRHRRR